MCANALVTPRPMSTYTASFLNATVEAASSLNHTHIDKIIEMLIDLRASGGRLFFLGVGGSAANASHAVNDFRKIAGIESYSASDNVAELTARINDDGWESSYANWLRVSRLNAQDAVFILSVGGGDKVRQISVNLVRSLEFAQQVGAKILGIVGRNGGYTAEVADACVLIPTISESTITPLVEAFQAIVLHLIVSHPRLRANEMKWESTAVLV